jgi:hypothetical protein
MAMEEDKFHHLLGKALTDKAFLEMLVDPNRQAEALEMVGIEANGEILESLNMAIGGLNGLKSQFGPGTAAA